MTAGRTKLYRAVREAEAQDIIERRAFTNPYGIEVKYFAFDRLGAVTYALLAARSFGEWPYYLFATAIKNELVPLEAYVRVDGGILAIAIPTELLANLGTPESLGVIDEGT